MMGPMSSPTEKNPLNIPEQKSLISWDCSPNYSVAVPINWGREGIIINPRAKPTIDNPTDIHTTYELQTPNISVGPNKTNPMEASNPP
jgi:hypothetical protein